MLKDLAGNGSPIPTARPGRPTSRPASAPSEGLVFSSLFVAQGGNCGPHAPHPPRTPGPALGAHLDFTVQQPCALDNLFCGHLEHLFPDSILLLKKIFFFLMKGTCPLSPSPLSLSFPVPKTRMKESGPLPTTQAAPTLGPGRTSIAEHPPPLPPRWPPRCPGSRTPSRPAADLGLVPHGRHLLLPSH